MSTTTVVLRRAEVMKRVGLRSSAFDELRHRPDFPRPIYITNRTPAWVEAEVEAFLKSLIHERDRAGGQS